MTYALLYLLLLPVPTSEEFMCPPDHVLQCRPTLGSTSRRAAPKSCRQKKIPTPAAHEGWLVTASTQTGPDLTSRRADETLDTRRAKLSRTSLASLFPPCLLATDHACVVIGTLRHHHQPQETNSEAKRPPLKRSTSHPPLHNEDPQPRCAFRPALVLNRRIPLSINLDRFRPASRDPFLSVSLVQQSTSLALHTGVP